MFVFVDRWVRNWFAGMIQKRIAASGGPSDFVYDREKFTLRRSNDVAFLGNVYLAWRQAKSSAKRKLLIDNFVTPFVNSAAIADVTWADAQEKLVAVVRERSFLAALDGPGWGLDRAADPAKRPPQEPISTWFCRALVLDFPTHVAVVNPSHLKDWNATFDEASALGLARLRAATGAKFNQVDGYYVGGWNDDYDSSRILVPGIFDDLPLDGAPVVCLPNRLTLMVTGENQHEAIKAMLKKAEEIVCTIAKPQNPAPLVIRNGEVKDFDVPTESPIFNEVQRAKKFAALHTYGDQKANLDRHYKEAGKDIFVGIYRLIELKTGGYQSQCVWSKGVPSLLPITDIVIFAEAGADPKSVKIIAKVPWADVVRVLEPLLLDTQMFPPRFYVSQYPREEQFQAMASRAAQA